MAQGKFNQKYKTQKYRGKNKHNPATEKEQCGAEKSQEIIDTPIPITNPVCQTTRYKPIKKYIKRSR